MASGAKRRASISMTTATDESEANHADDEAQAGRGRRDTVEEFMQPTGLTQAALAEAMGSSASTSTSCATTAAM